jgi:hypothetical protein
VTLPAHRLRARRDVPAAQAWQEAGIPADIVDHVLRPFFAGVVLEEQMSTSRRFTDLMMRMFVRGRSTVPAGGMQRLPEQLAARLTPGTVRLGTPVSSVDADHVLTTGGAKVSARRVLVATDGWAAAGLLPGHVAPPAAHGVTTVYHTSDRWPGASATLRLDRPGSPVANSIVISEAAPGYAPPGRALVSTSLVHRSTTEDPDGPAVRAALARLHGVDTARWEHVATYDLPRALPAMPAPHPFRTPPRVRVDGGHAYVAGDHRDTSSLQGALVSGRRVAQALLADGL